MFTLVLYHNFVRRGNSNSFFSNFQAKEEERIAKEKEATEKAAAAEKKKAELEARKEAEKKKQE